jgi:hypothetical protein
MPAEIRTEFLTNISQRYGLVQLALQGSEENNWILREWKY